MNAVLPDQVKQLREVTGAGMMDCKKALAEANGDFQKAQELLRKRGIEIANKKSTRAANEGRVFCYIHAGGKIAGLVELLCETDFVAKCEDFEQLGKDIAMQIAAASPRYLSAEHVPAEFIQKEKEILKAASADQLKGKPEAMIDKILEGKIKKRLDEICLLDQKFIKDPNQTIQGLLTAIIAKVGENIRIKRFTRFEVGHE
jgi:elongation factor Ts